MTEVMVLNSSYEFLQVMSYRKAIKLVIKGKAEVIKVSSAIIHSFMDSYPMPSVIRLLRMVKFRRKPIMFSRKNVLIRDNYICQYCGSHDKSVMTIDHIVPQSKGGPNTWENTVACCPKCNKAKGSLSLAAWTARTGYTLRSTPKPPSPFHFNKSFRPREEWTEFLYY